MSGDNNKKKKIDGRKCRRNQWDVLGMKDRMPWVEQKVLEGASNKDLARIIGVSERMIYTWKDEHPQFAQVLKRSKDVVDGEVANALLKRALGYDIKERRKESGVRSGQEVDVEVEYEKELPPDVKAAIFWLTNRQPEKWARAQQAANNINMQVNIVGMSQQEQDYYDGKAIEMRNIPRITDGDNGNNGNNGGNDDAGD